ncbi:unnamed protein product, partial [Brassica rapa subsp. trilocularis]
KSTKDPKTFLDEENFKKSPIRPNISLIRPLRTAFRLSSIELIISMQVCFKDGSFKRCRWPFFFLSFFQSHIELSSHRSLMILLTLSNQPLRFKLQNPLENETK